MTKSQLIRRLARDNPHLLRADAEKIVEVILEEIAAGLVRRGRVELRGFGVFAVKRRRAQMARNPRTGQPVAVAARLHPFFRPGKHLRARLNRAAAP